MRKSLSIVRADIIRPLFTAIFVFAMAFTFSCSSEDDNNNGGLPSIGSGISSSGQSSSVASSNSSRSSSSSVTNSSSSSLSSSSKASSSSSHSSSSSVTNSSSSSLSSSSKVSSSSSHSSSSSVTNSSSSSLSSSSKASSSSNTVSSSSSLAIYTVTYNANNGTGAPATQTKTHNVSLTLSTTKPTRTGYTFVAWNTESNGSGISYASGASYTVNANVTLYAQWTVSTYTVTYSSPNIGTVSVPAPQTKTHNVSLTLSTTKPTRTGYTFVTWSTEIDGGGTFYASGASYTANASVTLYAQWSRPVVSNCDDITFKTVVIGTQTWMAENLNCNISGSKCYNNNEYYCDTYGRLYDWETAMALYSHCNDLSYCVMKEPYQGICPSGWHIPNNEDWSVLMNFVNPNCPLYSVNGTVSVASCADAGAKLKAKSGWNGGIAGKDVYGFSALPGGIGCKGEGLSCNDNFYYAGDKVYWWSTGFNSVWSSGDKNAYYYALGLSSGDDIANRAGLPSSYLISVRCLKN